ncbi:MAG: ABC transporter ATP-binding protein [bacterium]|nr:ABC transporter ATP-binding protein [Candidatus Sumerlaeota bacterium]
MSEAATAVPVIRVKRLTKRFGHIIAVNDASFEVYESDIFGFLGPNGAGKSTTMYMMAGLVRPTSGTIEIFGLPHTNLERVRPRVGALIETPAFYEYLSGEKNLEILARLQPGITRARIGEVLEMTGLENRARDRVGQYSHGMKQRLGIAQALLGNPRLLLLDEPTSGLDPEGSAHIWELLQHLAAMEKITVFISSHLLHEVEEGCNRIAVINQGVIVACDQVRHLLFFSKEDYLLMFDDKMRRDGARVYLEGREGVEILSDEKDAGRFAAGEDVALRLRLQQGLSGAVVTELVDRGLVPHALIPQRKTLKQFFLELTRRQPERLPLV